MNLNDRFAVLVAISVAFAIIALPGCSCRLDELTQTKKTPAADPTHSSTGTTTTQKPVETQSGATDQSGNSADKGNKTTTTRTDNPNSNPSNGGSEQSQSPGNQSNSRSGNSSSQTGHGSTGEKNASSTAPGGFFSSIFGGSAGNGTSRLSAPIRKASAQEAKDLAEGAIGEAREAFASGSHVKAYKSAVTAYELLAPHANDSACGSLLKTLEIDLRRYAEAVEVRPVPESKPTFIR